MEHSRSAQPFPNVENGAVPPCPSELWAARIRHSSPLPTNSAWLNFVLNQGSCAEYLHPYLIQSSGGKLAVCYPTRGPNPDFIFQTFVTNLSVSCREEGEIAHVVSHYDDLSVTLEFGSRLTVPLVRGSPYVTFILKNGTPYLSTIHAVLELQSNKESTKHRLVMNNGQSWVIYCSSPLHLDKNLNVGGVGRHGFTGVIRIAMIPDGDSACSSILDRYSKCYPLGGMADLSIPFQVRYVWEKEGWGDLLMLSLPHHRELFSSQSVQLLPSVTYVSIDGPLQGVVGDSWTVKATPLSVNWYSSQGVGAREARNDILRALEIDVAALNPILNPSTYFHGKALARAARLALIAEEIGSPHLVEKVRAFLVDSITPWFHGTFAGNALVYDPKWGGLVSREGVKDAGADFGLAVYNDHHYHHGYFCYAGAVLAKVDPAWGRAFKSHLYALVGDFMTYNSTDSYFTRLRCFDPWTLHSWAGGLTEFADGRNQESTSEAVNAYYSAALVGLAYGDSHLINLGLTLTSLEIRSSQALWHIKTNSTLYEAEFVQNNRVVGVLWANKRDNGLWFASKDCREMRLGIQVLPITPITELLFQDKEFVQELVEWTVPALDRGGVTDGWRGFVYSLLAIYRPHEAQKLVSQLADHDDGNSLSNLLWWMHSRPRS